jgi:hypothetical protein
MLLKYAARRGCAKRAQAAAMLDCRSLCAIDEKQSWSLTV